MKLCLVLNHWIELLYYISSGLKYIIKLNKNNTCIYNYTGVYYFLSEGEGDRW